MTIQRSSDYHFAHHLCSSVLYIHVLQFYKKKTIISKRRLFCSALYIQLRLPLLWERRSSSPRSSLEKTSLFPGNSVTTLLLDASIPPMPHKLAQIHLYACTMCNAHVYYNDHYCGHCIRHIADIFPLAHIVNI